MARRFFRRRGRRSRTNQRIFWIRNSGSLTIDEVDTIRQSPLFSPNNMNPDVVTQRADINRVVTVMAIRFNYAAEINVTGVVSAQNADLYMGVYMQDRQLLPASAAFSGIADASSDWMDAWLDPVFIPSENKNTSFCTQHCSQTHRIIKTRRVLSSREDVNFSCVIFPHTALLPSSFQVVVNWQASILCRYG